MAPALRRRQRWEAQQAPALALVARPHCRCPQPLSRLTRWLLQLVLQTPLCLLRCWLAGAWKAATGQRLPLLRLPRRRWSAQWPAVVVADSLLRLLHLPLSPLALLLPLVALQPHPVAVACRRPSSSRPCWRCPCLAVASLQVSQGLALQRRRCRRPHRPAPQLSRPRLHLRQFVKRRFWQLGSTSPHQPQHLQPCQLPWLGALLVDPPTSQLHLRLLLGPLARADSSRCPRLLLRLGLEPALLPLLTGQR